MCVFSSSFNSPNIVSRMCCNRYGPSSYRWKEHAVKVVKLSDLLGLTNWSAWIQLDPSRRDSRGSVGVALLIGGCSVIVFGSIVGVIFSLGGASFHAAWLFNGVGKLACIGIAYFASMGAIGGIAALILHTTQPSHQAHQAYIMRSIQRWVENNEFQKVYAALPELDSEIHMDSQIVKTWIERLVESGYTDLSILTKLTAHLSPNDQNVFYERISTRKEEKDHDIKSSVQILSPQDPAKREESLEQDREPQMEEREVPRVGTEVICFTGDLNPLEKADLNPHFIDDYQLAITFQRHPEINVTIRRQNIFASQAQVIVNAANTHLGGGGGIDGAIHREGGMAYVQAHRHLQELYQANYIEGHAFMIGSGELKEKYNIDNVIVVAGPSGSTSASKETQLYSCYFNALEVADEQNKISIAIPSISTGIFGFPKDRAAAISLKAIQDFLNKHPNTQLKTISIHFLPNESLANLEIYRDQAS